MKKEKNNMQINKINAKVTNKNKIFSKIKSDIDKNCRIFFVTSKDIDHRAVIKETISNVTDTIETKTEKSKKKKIWNTLFFILNIVLIVFIFVQFANEQGGVQPLSTLFANKPNWFYLIIAVGLYIVCVICNSMKFNILIHNKTGKWNPWLSFKLATIGRYYDNVTPLGSGGQPFEIYYLKKNGYSGDTSTAIPLSKYMVWQVSFCLFALFILIFFPSTYTSSTLVVVCAWIGLAITAGLFLFVLFMSITKKWGASLVVGVLKLLYKMHIVKNYRRALENVLKFVKKYQYSIKAFIRSPWAIFGEILVTLGTIIANALIAYFVYASFVEVPIISWWEIICKCIICELAVSFFPMPGGTGASELSFNALMGSLFPTGTLFWGLLIWRFLTYYMYIIQGAGVLIGDAIASKIRKNRKKRIKNELKTQEKA